VADDDAFAICFNIVSPGETTMPCLFDHIKPGAFADGEQIEAIRICLCTASKTTAVVAEFRSADRLLKQWMTGRACEKHIDFHVTFNDGFVFFGCYEHAKRTRRKPSLSEYVRTSLNTLTEDQPAWLPRLSRYTVDS
jgi:hypothetical protein